MSRVKNSKRLLWIPLLLASAAVVLIIAAAFVLQREESHRTSRVTPAFQLPDQAVTFGDYAGSGSCRECHAEAYDAWARSHHALAERAVPEDMNPAFDPPRTVHHGTQTAWVGLASLRSNASNGLVPGLRPDARPVIVAPGVTGTNETFTVDRILAHHPLRQMLIPFPGGRFQASELAWDPRSNEWFNVFGLEDRQPGEWGHWTGRGMTWNSMCATCHNTRLRKNYDATSDTYRTAMVERGVGCEACHGPMKSHNDWQHANRGKGLRDPTTRRLTRDEMFDTCAACHSRRGELTGDPKPGDSFFDHHRLSIVDGSDLFHSDGQVRDEDFEVSSFLSSRMFHKGVRCVDCHDVHTMKPRLPGNFLCLTCHGPGSTQAPVIDPVAHSRHRVFGYDTNGVLVNVDVSRYDPRVIKETGGECVNCHMPQTVFMQRHARHDHGFTIPDPLLTKEFGIPNACNRCHADKSTDWSLAHVENWYGDRMNRPYRNRARVFARARNGDAAVVTGLLQILEGDEIPYWRAVAANLLKGWAGDKAVANALMGQLQHTNALVRENVIQALGAAAQSGDTSVANAITARLEDSSRNVRIEAARVLAAQIDTNSLAGSEYLHFLNHIADQPSGQVQLGLFSQARGRMDEALKHFSKAAEWDPFSAELRHELALLLSQAGRAEEALQQMEHAVRLAPADGDLRFKLALALSEAGQSGRVISELEQAVRLDPRHSRAWYNLGLLRSGQGELEGAVQAMNRAERLDPQEPAFPFARATVLARLGRVAEARAAARRALELNPRFDAARELLVELR